LNKRKIFRFALLSKAIVSNPRSRNFHGSRSAVLAAVGLTVISAAPVLAFSGAKHCFTDSIKDITSDPHVRAIRQTLKASERNEILQFSVSLKMPNFEELEFRIAHGEQIPPDVMAARYLPSASDYAAVEAWLKGQGFKLTQKDPNHTNIFASGTVLQVEHSMGVNFARLATVDGEFTSAITAPNLPNELSRAVLTIDGLQPHLRMHHQLHVQPNILTLSGQQYFVPADILAAYNAPSTLNGAGQTIAIVMDATVSTSDLSTFYSTVGSTATTANFTTIKIDGGPTSGSQSSGALEAALDVEWASGMAPGAQVRLYAIPALSNLSIIDACNQILIDAPANNITVVSVSVGGLENGFPNPTKQADSQDFAQMAAAGITVLFASGDGGSNPGSSDGSYNIANPLQPEYPASDPNVAGVGGTELLLTPGTFSYAGETVFSTISGGTGDASGGGISQFFARPSWQNDGGTVLTNPNRCVPDVSIVWDAHFQGSNFGPNALVVLNGNDDAVGGTSLSVQIWGGIVALLSQGRKNTGQSPIGLLGPVIYPLHGTSALNDITSGNNGAYSAGPGYDLCTGLGSPNIGNLVLALVPTVPSIVSQPQSVTVTTGSAFSLGVTAIGSPTLAYQWSQNGAALNGATSPTYFVNSAAPANAGSYTVVVSNSFGTVTSNAATVTVNPPPPVSGGGGGGGAFSYGFYLTLAMLFAIRAYPPALRSSRIGAKEGVIRGKKN
jgi:kumamolisin